MECSPTLKLKNTSSHEKVAVPVNYGMLSYQPKPSKPKDFIGRSPRQLWNALLQTLAMQTAKIN